ncbi:hypothetical protein [Sphaerisporangium aureirubrum]|uniref:Uncharacterized protein n=1 Tax=Sphaerisporangium aureirubrum TaxID=1544736 RepID=A0ABW1NN46_9ACTN
MIAEGSGGTGGRPRRLGWRKAAIVVTVATGSGVLVVVQPSLAVPLGVAAGVAALLHEVLSRPDDSSR